MGKEECKKSVEAMMLERMYKNVRMGAESMINLMPKVSDKDFRNTLTCQLDKYDKYGKKISDMIYNCGYEPKDENFMTKMSAKMGIAMNTATDSSTSKIAQMVIEGATLGMTDMTKIIRDFENTECGEKELKLARDIADFEDNSIDELKKYL